MLGRSLTLAAYPVERPCGATKWDRPGSETPYIRARSRSDVHFWILHDAHTALHNICWRRPRQMISSYGGLTYSAKQNNRINIRRIDTSPRNMMVVK